MTQREKSGGIYLHGTHRIKVLSSLMAGAHTLRIWEDEHAGASAWEVVYDEGRFFLMISPEVQRGFSGEGQLLEILARNSGRDIAPFVRGRLNWQHEIDAHALAGELNTGVDQIQNALAVLGARGLAGYDVSRSAYFHRELPFQMEQVEKLQPRLKAARKLVEAGGVRFYNLASEDQVDLLVQGTGVEHYVRLRPGQDRCSCRWFSRYQGQRGVCKHILAARLVVDDEKKVGRHASC